jgi:hypothetical protein
VADRPGHSFEDTLRLHDAAFYSFWDALHVDYGNLGLGLGDNLESPFAPIDRNDFPILRVFASPQRAVARVVDTLMHTGWLAGADAAAQAASAVVLREKAMEDFAILPLPLLTIFRDDPVDRPEDQGIPKVFRKQCFDESTGSYQTQRWPGAWDIPYRVTCWTIKRYTLEFIREWLMSQIGKPGVSGGEVLIPVDHGAPWGVIRQTLTLDGMGDQSALEGDADARMIRSEFSFRLKGWHFQRPLPVKGVDPSLPGASTGQVPAIQDLNFQETVFLPGAALGIELDPLDFGGDPALVPPKPVGLNMFSFFIDTSLIPTHWPKLGNASVRRGNISPSGKKPVPTLRIEVQDPTDEVLVSNRTVPLDADALAILTMIWDYKATDATQLLVAHKPPGSGQPFASGYVQDLPAAVSWTHGQVFALIDEPVYSVSVAGTGTAAPAKLDLSQIDLRHVRSPATKTLPDTSVPGGGQTVHTFGTGTPLEDRPHLAVVVFTGTPAADTIDVNGELYAVDPAERTVGLVAIFTPSGGVATVTVPDTIPALSVYVQRYRGPWNGTEV